MKEQDLSKEKIGDLPNRVEKNWKKKDLRWTESIIYLYCISRYQAPSRIKKRNKNLYPISLPNKMKVKAREGMEKEGGELVQAVEDHAVVPHDDGGHEAAHAHHIVSLLMTHILT